jgi:hypothetical protein
LNHEQGIAAGRSGSLAEDAPVVASYPSRGEARSHGSAAAVTTPNLAAIRLSWRL